MATEALGGSHGEGHWHLPHWQMPRHGREVLWGLAFTATLMVLVTLVSYVLKQLATTSEVIELSSVEQFWAHTPMMLFTLFLTITLVPATFGLTIVLAAVVLAGVMPFIRERVMKREAEQWRQGRPGAAVHMHIPETGFDAPAD